LRIERFSTILAGSPVSDKEVLSREFNKESSSLDEMTKTDDGRKLHRKPHPSNQTIILFDDLHFSKENQQDGLLPMNHF